MKFKFCGDGDCPEWVLAGIHSQLASLSSIKLKLLSVQLVKSLLGDELPEDKLKDLFKTSDVNNPKAAVACLKYLLVSAVRFNADAFTFNEELQQLGLQKENASAICKVFEEYGEKLKEHQISKSLTVNKFENVTVKQPSNTIDCIQLDFELQDDVITGFSDDKRTQSIIIEKKDIPTLLKELKTINNLLGVDFK